MPVEPRWNPMPLAYVSVAAVPVSIIVNYPTYTELTAKSIDFQAHIDNASPIGIGYSDINLTTGIGLLKVLQPGESWSLTDPTANANIPAKIIYIHGVGLGDKVLPSAHVG
jgi:hypothetical protein